MPIARSISWTHDLARIDWDELAALYRAAQLGDKSAGDLKLVFINSMFRAFAFEGDVLVGAGRALADGRDCSYLCDIAVMPSHQGIGLGKEIVARLVRLSASHRKIILYAVLGKEAFYEAFGFRRPSSKTPPRATARQELPERLSGARLPIVPAHRSSLHAPVGLPGLRPLAAYWVGQCSKTVHPSVVESA